MKLLVLLAMSWIAPGGTAGWSGSFIGQPAGGAVAFTPALKFNDARNSMYAPNIVAGGCC